MCYSIVSMVSQSSEVPASTANLQSTVPYYPTQTVVESPATSSGYSSYASPVGTPDHSPNYDLTPPIDPSFSYDEQAALQNCYDYCNSPASTPISPFSPQYAGQPQHCNGYMQDSSYCPVQPELCLNPCYNQNGDPAGTLPNFGMVQGSNFMFTSYPQSVEPVSPMEGCVSYQVCRICGDSASGNHFGVQSCEACKSFFRRSIRANSRYACRGSRNCVIEKHSRNRCQYCRLQKCLFNGMRKEAVQEERHPVQQDTKQQSVIVQKPRDISPRDRVSVSSEEFSGSPSSSEKRRTSFNGSPSSSPNSTARALLYADLKSEKSTPPDRKSVQPDFFSGLEAYLYELSDWAKRMPTFLALSLDEQVKLLKSSWCELFVLKLAALNKATSENVVLVNGLSCAKELLEDVKSNQIMDRVFAELSYWLEHLNADATELACLKGILLFNPDAKGMTATSKKNIEICQEKILQSLESQTKAADSVSPQRFSKLLLRLAPLKAISLEVMQHLEVQRALGNLNIDNLLLN